MVETSGHRTKWLITNHCFPLLQQSQNIRPQSNIFATRRSVSPIQYQKLRGRSFDFVGNQQFKLEYLQCKNSQQKQKTKINQKQKKQKYIGFEKLNEQHPNTNITTNNVINQTGCKSQKKQKNNETRQMRQLSTYSGYRKWWNAEIGKLHHRLLKKKNQPTLLEEEVKTIYIHPNKDKVDIINDHVVNMWQMSLRNNDKKLQEHIKGNKFNQRQLQNLMQTDGGMKKIEKSIPLLPFEKMKRIQQRKLILRGTNKSALSTPRAKSMIERFNQTQRGIAEQVYKMNNNKKWV